MAEREVRIKFTGESGVLKGQAGELRTLFQNMVNDVDDARLAGEKWADAYGQQSQRIKGDMADVETSARVLADSLGPEMVQALDQSGRSVEQQVQELIKLGLTHDDIRMSSDQLAAAIKERDDVLRAGAGQIGDGFRKVSAEVDQTRSVVANFAGNAIQELPGVANAMGPLNMAIGQFTEYAAEGNIKLSSFVKAGAGLAAAGVAMWALGQGAKQAAERTEEINEAMRELDRLSDAAALQAFGDMLVKSMMNGEGFAGTMENLAETNIIGARRILELGEAAGMSAEMMDTLAAAIRDAEENEARADRNAERYGGTVADLGDKSANAGLQIGDMAGALGSVRDEASGAAGQVKTLGDRFAALLGTFDDADALDAAVDAFDEVRTSAEEAYIAAASGAEDAEAQTREHERAVRDLTRGVIDYADELGNVPPRVVSEVVALINQGKFDEAKLLVQSWANEPTYKYVTIKAIGDVGYMKDENDSRAGLSLSPVAQAQPERSQPVQLVVDGRVLAEVVLEHQKSILRGVR